MKEHYDKEAREYFEMYWSSDELIDKVMEQIDEIERLNEDNERLMEQIDEIERLNKYNGDIIKLFAKEREETKRLHSIIKEAREYIVTIKDEDIQYTIGWVKQDILEILDKENK